MEYERENMAAIRDLRPGYCRECLLSDQKYRERVVIFYSNWLGLWKVISQVLAVAVTIIDPMVRKKVRKVPVNNLKLYVTWLDWLWLLVRLR